MELTVNISWLTGHVVNRSQWALREFSHLMSRWILNTYSHLHMQPLFIWRRQRKTVKCELRQKKMRENMPIPCEPHLKRLYSQLFVAAVKGFVLIITSSVCFLHVLNDFGILRDLVQSSSSLMWYCSAVRAFQGETPQVYVEYKVWRGLQSCPKSPVNHVRCYNGSSLEMQLCANDASITYNHRSVKKTYLMYTCGSIKWLCCLKWSVIRWFKQPRPHTFH